MNKGAPAGNVIRKQVSLLPKYQLTTTPVDANKVSVKLTLLNHSQLTENLEELTAGESHKFYIIVGDSQNHLLFLKSFKDKDLISIYEGTITFDVIRKHNFEHKILVHCVSTSFVGLDAQVEYLFKNIKQICEQEQSSIKHSIEDINGYKVIKKQTNITDAFKNRKRKNDDNNVRQLKEKMRRDMALTEKIKNLKDSFGTTSKELREDLHEMISTDNPIFPTDLEAIYSESNYVNPVKKTTEFYENCGDTYTETKITGTEDDDYFMVDERVDSILNEIEKEISNRNNENDWVQSNKITAITVNVDEKDREPVSSYVEDFRENKIKAKTSLDSIKKKKTNELTRLESGKIINEMKKRKTGTIKSNYNFIDLLNESHNSSNTEEVISNNCGGFSETIKGQLGKFLQTTHISKHIDKNLEMLIESDRTEKINTIDLTSINITEVIPRMTQKRKNIAVEEDDINKSNYLHIGKHVDINEIVKTNIKSNEKESSIENFFLGDIVIINDCSTQASEFFKNECIENITKPEVKKQDEFSHNTKELISTEFDKMKNGLEVEIFTENCKKNIYIDPNEDVALVNKSISESRLLKEKTRNAKNNKTKFTDSTATFLHSLSGNNNDILPVDDTSDRSNKELKLKKGLDAYQHNCMQVKPYFRTLTPEILSETDKLSPFLPNQCSNNEHLQRKEYINEYSFTTSKIKVCTQNTAAHQIQIIRKLKVDLNLTELITKNSSNSNYSAKYDHSEMNSEFKYSIINPPLLTKNIKFNQTIIQSQTVKDDTHKKVKSLKDVNIDKKAETLTRDYQEQQIISKIRDILQKYSKILLKKNDCLLNNTNTFKNHKPSDENKVILKKSKRMFNISDINNIDLSLPKTLVDDSCKMSPPVNTSLTELKYKEATTRDYKNIEENNRKNSDNSNIHIEIPDLHKDISDCEISLLSETSEAMEFHIDQSMFNPKTLLASLNVDFEEVIPPPLEFCDENICSSEEKYDNFNMDEIILPNHCESIFGFTENNNTLENNDEKTIFEDSSLHDLTPTKEIETWTLSQDDSWNAREYSNSKTSCTIMRKSTVSSRNSNRAYESNNSNSDKSKLGHYKFTHKQKLRL